MKLSLNPMHFPNSYWYKVAISAAPGAFSLVLLLLGPVYHCVGFAGIYSTLVIRLATSRGIAVASERGRLCIGEASVASSSGGIYASGSHGFPPRALTLGQQTFLD